MDLVPVLLSDSDTSSELKTVSKAEFEFSSASEVVALPQDNQDVPIPFVNSAKSSHYLDKTLATSTTPSSPHVRRSRTLIHPVTIHDDHNQPLDNSQNQNQNQNQNHDHNHDYNDDIVILKGINADLLLERNESTKPISTDMFNSITSPSRQRDKPQPNKMDVSETHAHGKQTRIWQYMSSMSTPVPTVEFENDVYLDHDNLVALEESDIHCIPIIEKEPITYPMSGVHVKFPFEAYQSQKQMMSKIIKAIKDRSNALLESPTGTGKSLALLCASLAWQSKIKEERLQWFDEVNKKPQEKKKPSPPTSIQPASNSNLPLTMSVNTFSNDEDFNYTVHIHKPTPPTSLQAQATSTSTSNAFQSNDFPPRVPKIFYTSRTHKQITQVIKELKNNTQYRPDMTVLGSRNHYCVFEQVLRSSNRDEVCQKHVAEKTCKYYENARNLRYSKHIPPIWDIEDLKVIGRKIKGCPFYASRMFIETAELIFCPYNYLIDPTIRIALELDLADNIVIVDEGHNIEECAREIAKCEMDNKLLDAILAALKDLAYYIGTNSNDLDDFKLFNMNEPIRVTGLLRLTEAVAGFLGSHLSDFDYKEFDKHSKVVFPKTFVDYLASMSIYQSSVFEMINECKALSSASIPDPKTGRKTLFFNTGFLLPIRRLLLLMEFILNPRYTMDFHVIIEEKITVGRRKTDEWSSQIIICCMNPGVTFSKLNEARTVILTSGTLSPMDTFASELQTHFPVTLEADHVLQPHQSWVGVFPSLGAVSFSGIYKNAESFSYQDGIGNALLYLLPCIPNGVLLFVPSYLFMDKLMKRWKNSGCLDKLRQLKPVFQEHKSQDSFEPLLAGYYTKVTESIKGVGNGALLIAVYRGKVSEGIDFSDERARAVICVGIPYPSVKDLEINLKKKYNDDNAKRRNLLSGKSWYEIQAYRALNQALGRCLRHRNDWGALILIEERFKSPHYQNHLSKWVRNRIVVYHEFKDGLVSLQAYIQSNMKI